MKETEQEIEAMDSTGKIQQTGTTGTTIAAAQEGYHKPEPQQPLSSTAN
jgi:hypothetical protein